MKKFYCKLLRIDLPCASINANVDASDFFNRSEGIAKVRRWRIDRRRKYAGEGYDLLNLHLRPNPSGPILRMVATPKGGRRIDVDVVTKWKSGGPDYDEYVPVLRDTSRQFLDAYNTEYRTKIRLGMPRKPLDWDAATVDCDGLEYVRGKFDEAVRSLALGEGDMRTRLESVYMTLHVVRSDDLPPPLRPHWEWVVKELTYRPARYRLEGTLQATLSQMRNTTGRKIAERIYQIRDALNDLCPDEYYWMTD